MASRYGLHLEIEAAQPGFRHPVAGAELLQEAVLLNAVDRDQHGPERGAVRLAKEKSAHVWRQKTRLLSQYLVGSVVYWYLCLRPCHHLIHEVVATSLEELPSSRTHDLARCERRSRLWRRWHWGGGTRCDWTVGGWVCRSCEGGGCRSGVVTRRQHCNGKQSAVDIMCCLVLSVHLRVSLNGGSLVTFRSHQLNVTKLEGWPLYIRTEQDLRVLLTPEWILMPPPAASGLSLAFPRKERVFSTRGDFPWNNIRINAVNIRERRDEQERLWLSHRHFRTKLLSGTESMSCHSSSSLRFIYLTELAADPVNRSRVTVSTHCLVPAVNWQQLHRW